MGRVTPSTIARITAEMQFTGNDLDFAACAAAIGLEPTRVWRRGRPGLPDRPDIANSQFVVGVDGRYDSIEEPLEVLIAKVWPHRDQIVSWVESTRIKAGITCVVRVDELPPEYCLEPELIRKLAAFPFPLCLSIYDESSEPNARVE
jgi:Domain of unknown function (DUF4279)